MSVALDDPILSDLGRERLVVLSELSNAMDIIHDYSPEIHPARALEAGALVLRHTADNTDFERRSLLAEVTQDLRDRGLTETLLTSRHKKAWKNARKIIQFAEGDVTPPYGVIDIPTWREEFNTKSATSQKVAEGPEQPDKSEKVVAPVAKKVTRKTRKKTD